MKISHQSLITCTFASISLKIGRDIGIGPLGKKIALEVSQNLYLMKMHEKDGLQTLNSVSKIIMKKNLNCSYH